MFQVRELSIKVAVGEEARGPLLACNVCDSTPEGTCSDRLAPLLACNVCNSTPGTEVDCPTVSMAPLLACNVCNSTAEGVCPSPSVAAQALDGRRDGLQLLREQLRLQLAQLN